MVDISKLYPNPVNIEGLMQTVRATYPEASQDDNGFRVHNIAPENEATVSADLDTMIATHNPNELTSEQQIESAQSGLLDKVLLAEQYASDIRTIYNLVLDFTELQITQPTRFNNLLSAFTASAMAFRNRFITDCEQELGFNPTGTLTVAQQRQTTLYARVWITPLVLLLMARKVL